MFLLVVIDSVEGVNVEVCKEVCSSIMKVATPINKLFLLYGSTLI